jgi:hypothetical protein
MKILVFSTMLVFSMGCQTTKNEEVVVEPLQLQQVLSCETIAEMIAQDLDIAGYQNVEHFEDNGGALIFLSYNFKTNLSAVDVFTPPGYNVPEEHILSEGRECFMAPEAGDKALNWKHWYLRDYTASGI